MKKFLAPAVAVFALVAVAAPEKFASVQVADTKGLVAAASKFGEFTGNAMLGTMLAAQIAKNPLAQAFGPEREGAATLLSVYADGEIPADLSKAGDGLSGVLVYPLTRTKAQVLEAFPGAKEEGGVVALNGTGALGKLFVAFTRDGRWLVASDRRELVATGLGDIASAARPMAGDVLRFRGGEKLMKLAADMMDRAVAEAGKNAPANVDKTGVADALALIRAVYGQILSFSAGLAVDEKGITFTTSYLPAEGSVFAQIGMKPLAGDALAFAGKDVFLASAVADGCGQGDAARRTDAFFALLAKNGIATNWLVREKTQKGERYTVDVDGAVGYFTSAAGKAAFKAIDPETFVKDYSAISTREFSAGGTAWASSFAIKGVTFPTTASARFAKIAPEVAAKKPYCVEVVSLYALLKALAPKAVALLPTDSQPAVKPLVDALPAPGEGGVAVALWREKNLQNGLFRLSPDEVRGFAAVVNTCVGVYLSSAIGAAGETGDGDDD